MTGATTHSKAVNTEDRLDALVPRIPIPQTSPANATNGSTSIVGQNTVGPAPGGANATWYQEVQTTIAVLFGAFNALQASHTALVNSHNALLASLKNSAVLQ
jgi:hypothetical protein